LTGVPADLTFRSFGAADYDELIALWNRVGLSHKPRGRDRREALVRELKNPASRLILAVHRQRIVGSVLATHDGRKGWINRLAVDTSFQHRGLGGQLIGEAERFLRQQGIRIIACLIEDFNTPSLNLFVKCGYQEFKGVHYLTKKEHPEV